jgi:hypothetical protein
VVLGLLAVLDAADLAMVVAESLRGLPLAESSPLPQKSQRFAEFPLPERGFGGFLHQVPPRDRLTA